MDVQQRGLHGSAAALRVLADSEVNNAGTLVKGLVTYLDGKIPERLSPGEISPADEKTIRDAANVIKIAEVLYALAFVRASQTDGRNLITRLATRLQNAIRDGNGWAYFTDVEAPPELLPTAYAIRALNSHGYTVSQQASWLHDSLRREGQAPPDPRTASADITTRIACLFALSFPRKPTDNGAVFEDLAALLNPIWKAMEPSLAEPIEQNVEYVGHERTFYVRVPWQLYLLALSAKHSYFLKFSSYRTQQLLDNLLRAIDQKQMRYPQSGRLLSSRTYGIAYDVLSIVERENYSRRSYWPAYAIDRTRIIFGSKLVRALASIIAGILITFVLYRFVTNPHRDIADIAPDIIAALLVWLLSAGRR